MIDRAKRSGKLALNAVRYLGIASLAKPFTGGIGAILMLHRVTATPARPDSVNRHLNIAPEFLDAVIRDMKAAGYAFVSMDEAVSRIETGGKGGRFAALTADDGYRDNITEALPILEEHGVPITIYVAPALIDGSKDLWWDVLENIVAVGDMVSVPTPGGPLALDCSTPARKLAANARLHDHFVQEVPEEGQRDLLRQLARSSGVDADTPRRDTLMDWNELARAAAHPLVTIGAHTVSHYNLRRLGEPCARREIENVRCILEERLGKNPRHLAYPYGYANAVGEREVRLAREAGYVSAVTTRHGVLHTGHAGFLHALPRISVNGRYQNVAHIRTMLSGVTTPLANAGRMVVTV